MRKVLEAPEGQINDILYSLGHRARVPTLIYIYLSDAVNFIAGREANLKRNKCDGREGNGNSLSMSL